MDGILNVLKPPGMTSFDVVAWLRKILKTSKIGHTGTLDPLAAGVLPVCVGRATKAVEFLMNKDKTYRAELTLGMETDTQDSGGRIISSARVLASDEEIIDAVRSFRGKYMQVPPMYSAVRVKGKKLYELARKGIEVERKAREVEIYCINVLDIKRDSHSDEHGNGPVRVLFDVHCSKGTYIRTLCADIGQKLGCGGIMSFLLRKSAGIFQLENALTLEEIASAAASGYLEDLLLKVDIVFSQFQEIKLNQLEQKRFLNGVSINARNKEKSGVRFEPGYVRVYGESGDFIALGEFFVKGDNIMLRSKKIFQGHAEV